MKVYWYLKMNRAEQVKYRFALKNEWSQKVELIKIKSNIQISLASDIQSTMQDRKIFEDRFKVEKIDPDNKTPFRNVSRIHMVSQYKLNMEVDINTQIYPIALKESFLIRVSNCDNVPNVYVPEQSTKPSEKDNFDYVSYGVVFDVVEKNNEITVFASFGGLIMRVNGKANSLSAFRKDGKEARIYLMIKRA